MAQVVHETGVEAAGAIIARLGTVREHIYRSGTARGQDGSIVQVMPTGMGRDRGEALRGLVIAERARTCVETGFAFGMSSSFILEGLISEEDAAAAVEGVRLVSMDPFQSGHWKGAGTRHLREAGAAALHRLHEEPSEVVLPRLIAEGQRFDFAFIDGDHRFEGVFADVLFARRLVGAGKMIVLDDEWMPSAKKAAAFFESAALCKREPTRKGSPLAKFILLRVTPEGDARAWDHYAEF